MSLQWSTMLHRPCRARPLDRVAPARGDTPRGPGRRRPARSAESRRGRARAMRLDQHRLALPAREPARQHDDRHAVRQRAMRCASWIMRSASPRRGSNIVEVDAARDDRARGRRSAPYSAAHMSRDEFRDRDHPLAARHDRVVAALERVPRVVGAVERGDEMRARRGARRCARSTPARGCAHARCRRACVARSTAASGATLPPHDQRVLANRPAA